jgi:hypothetical protein
VAAEGVGEVCSLPMRYRELRFVFLRGSIFLEALLAQPQRGKMDSLSR